MNNNDQTILSDEELDTVVKTLEENKNETDSILDKIEKETENYDNSNSPLEHGVGEYISDGVIMEQSDDLDFSNFDNIDVSMDELFNANIKENITKNYNISDEEALAFANLIINFRTNNGKISNIYESLPSEIKKIIDDLCKDQTVNNVSKKQLLEYTSKMFIKELISDTEFDSITLDLEKAMKELIPTPTEMYSETNREYIETEFPKVAEKIKETDPKKAQNLLDMRQGFIDAYTFEPMYELFKNSKIIKNVRRSESLWSRINNEYVSIAGVCKFNLYPLNELISSLMTIGYNKTQSIRVISLFVYTYTNGINDYKDDNQYNQIYRNAFANYFEANIRNLAISPSLVSDFSKNIKENLDVLINHIDSIICQKEAELSNKKKKKRR